MSLNKTPIDWVKNPDGTQGYTWNPITGCLNGCEYCYARKLANTRLRERYLANTNIATSWETGGGGLDTEILAHNNPFYPRFWEDRIEELITRNDYLDGNIPIPTKPRGIFVCDMSDLFGIGVPEEWTKRVLRVIDENKYYDRFYLLTKQPQNLPQWSPFPDNCWVGVTATDEVSWLKAIVKLHDIKAKTKYISFEPLLEELDPAISSLLQHGGINGVIIGSQTKPYRPPTIKAVEEIVRACDKAGIPVFLKNNLSDLIPINSPLRYGPAGELRLRQELP